MTESEAADSRQCWIDLAETVAAQEDAISFGRFDYGDGWNLGSAIVALARERSLPIAVAVTFGQQRVFHAALPGSSATNDDWLQRKFAVVAKHNCSSYLISCRTRSLGSDYYSESGYARADFALAGGAVPLRVAGSLIGAVGVSGLAEDEDHALVIEALRAYLREQ